MPEISLPQFIGILAAAANIGIALMIIILLGERSHAAWTRVRLRAEEFIAMKAELEVAATESERAVQQLRDDIATLQSQVQRAEQDMEALHKRHRETDLPAGYTATPVDIVDRRYRTWRVVVRNPDLGADAGSFSHPAHRWIEGRLFDVPAPNMEYAVEMMQGRFLARDGYSVEPARDPGSRDVKDALSAEVG
ncbi:hypothetical protein [Ferrovibrio sp.]|uniref:hypothetical protein n=1 Tax=Ferrovibrio sp. TaxID=1917215 RepID=UPI0035AE03B6